MDEHLHIRERKICLNRSGDTHQVEAACAALRGIQGVYHAQPVSNYRLTLTYSLQYLSFELIEALLKELGFYLDNSIFAIIRRNIYQYLEDNVREKLRLDEEKQALVCDIDADIPNDEPEKYWNNYR